MRIQSSPDIFWISKNPISWLWFQQILHSRRIKLVHALVRQSTLHYHYRCIFTSNLASFTSKSVSFDEEWHAVYRVALIQSRDISLVVTHHTVSVRLLSDRPVTRFLVPFELSTIISDVNVATYVVKACVS